MFRSVWDRVQNSTVHSVYMRPVRKWNDTVPYGITIISGPITEFTRSRINTRLIRTNVVPVRNGSRSRVNAALFCNDAPTVIKDEQKHHGMVLNSALNFYSHVREKIISARKEIGVI